MACAAAPAAPTAPVALGAMFDGEPDPSVKLAAPKLYGKASISLPEGWEARGGWESVDHVAKSDGSAGIVLLRLDISEALLDVSRRPK